MAYDAVRGVTVLSSGWKTNADVAVNDTWEWDGTDWTERTAVGSPPALLGFGAFRLVYDSDRKVVVSFMDEILGRNTMVHEYNGNTWTRRNPQGPLQSAAFAYDTERKVSVLFEDHTGLTWLWDGVSWEQQSPVNSPTTRRYTSASYDSYRKVAVLFGGNLDQSNDLMNDTWEWDGTNWTEKEPANKPPVRCWHMMAYDSARNVTVMFGGGTRYDPTLNDTWEWDGTDWKEIQLDEKPGKRFHHAMAYDSGREKVVLFGGHFELEDTWEYGVFQ
jgi:hypothetical protein